MATYNANISVKVAGLTQLKNLENRVSQLQDRFTKLNAAAARITAPFQGHIKALTEINKLLRENNTLLNQQSRIANAVGRGRGGGGGGGSGTDPRVQREVAEMLQRQVRLLYDRAKAVGANKEVTDKLRKATDEIAGGSARNLQLARALLRNATQLVKLDEDRAKAAEEVVAAVADEADERVKNLQLARELYEFERQAAADLRAMRKRDREIEKEGANRGKRVRQGGRLLGRVGGALDNAFGGVFSKATAGVTNSALRFGAAGALMTTPLLGAGVRGLSNFTGPLKEVVDGLGQMIQMAHNLPGGMQAAIAALVAFSPLVASLAEKLPSAAQGVYKLGQSFGSLGAAQPLKQLLNQGGASFTESIVNPLSAMNMKLPAGPGVQSPGSASAAAFGSNMGLNLVKQAADQMLVAIQAAADKQEQARQTAQGWANALKQGQEWIRESTARIREFEGTQSEAARKRLAASTRTVGSSMTVVAQEAGRQQYAYNRELFPGGNTMTAQPQYRQKLNNAAITEASKTLQIRYNWMQVLKQGLEIQKDITEAVKAEAAEEAKALQAAQQKTAYDEMRVRRENRNRERRSRVERLRTETGTVSARERRAFQNQRMESIALGVGFPLMFGAGPGSILGSLGGSFFGSGFGGQIAGGAIGQLLDQFATGAMDAGKALRDPITNFEQLREKGLFASQAQEQLIANLIELGRVSEAVAQINAAMIEGIGVTGVNDLNRLGDSSDKLSKAWAELNLQMQAAIAGPLAQLLDWVTSVVRLMGERNAVRNEGRDVLRSLTPEQENKFREEFRRRTLNISSGTERDAIAKELFTKYQALAKPQELAPTKLDPKAQQDAADKQLDAAERAEALRRQGIQLDRQAQDLRLQIEDQVYGFRQRAADLERANIDLRRSVEDEIFRKRQDIARIEADNARAQAQLAIERLDMQLAGGRVGGNVPGQDIANQLLEGVRQYVKARAEGEADLQQKERMHVIEMEDLKRSAERFRFDVARKVDDLNRQGAELSRDVERAKLTTARAIYDLQVQAADYQIAKAKEAIALMSDPAARLSATEALSNGVGGKVVAHLHGDPGRVGYDPAGHGGEKNAHDHYRFDSPETARRVAAELSKLGYTITELKGVTSVGSHSANGGHYDGTAFDVPWSQFGSGAIGERDFARSRDLQADILRILGQGGGSVAVPSATAPALPASVGQAGSALSGVKIPGAADVSGLMASMSQLDQKLLSAKTNALELAKAFAQLNKEQAAMALSNSVGAIVDQLNAPLDQLLKEQQNAAAFQREYAGLIAEGVTPALAEQVARIREQVRLQLEQLDTAVLQLEATKVKLEAEGKWTEELQKQLDLLKAQKEIIEGKGAEAEGGASAAASPGQRLNDAYTKVQGQLNDLMDPVNQITAGAEAIGSAFGEAFKGVASGAMTAQEALARMFQSIADHFLDMAAKMIAKWIEMQILGLAMNVLGGAAGGGGGSSIVQGFDVPAASMPAGMAFASGGFVTGPTNALIGEGGANEYVIPENKMGSAMSRWSQGVRGSAVVEGARGGVGGGEGDQAAMSAPINITTGPVMEFNGARYVSQEQFAAGIRSAAKQGEQRALGRLRNSPGARAKVGL